MKSRHEIAVLAISAAIMATATWLWRQPVLADFSAHQVTAVASLEPPDRSALLNASQGVISLDPFRIDRTPSTVLFDPQNSVSEQVVNFVPTAPRPVLTLRGIVGGPPWQALIEGAPGRNAPALVSSGDTLGELRVQSVSPDLVILRGMDSTWHLSIARVWR